MQPTFADYLACQPASNAERSSRRPSRAAQAARERRVAMGVAAAVVVAMSTGIALHTASASASTVAPAAKVVASAGAPWVACPANGCTAQSCHGPLKHAAHGKRVASH